MLLQLSTAKLAQDTGGTEKILAGVAELESRSVAWPAGVLSLCSVWVCAPQF